MSRLSSVKPRPVQHTSAAASVLPEVVQAQTRDESLLSWLEGREQWVQNTLHTSGGILFRGFGIADPEAFRAVVRRIAPELLEYKERSTPRTEVGNRIYTSTEYPAHQHIALHNEFSYAYTWPMRIFFYAMEPASEGGETPLADSRRIYNTISKEIRDRFSTLGVTYVRNYGSGVDLPWQEAFQTSDKAAVEEHCRNAPLEFEWLPGDRLRTKQHRPATAVHPVTGEQCWFNQAHLFHVSNLGTESAAAMRAVFAEEDLPRNAYFGDGSPIDDADLEVVREAMSQATVAFPWQQNDILALDNMLIAHGRNPYRGSRKILAALAQPWSLPAESRSLEGPGSIHVDSVR